MAKVDFHSKRGIALIVAVVVLVAVLAVTTIIISSRINSSSSSGDNINGSLTSTQIKQIKTDYLATLSEKGTISDVFFDHYYGTYNGSVVLMITDSFSDYHSAEWGLEVAGQNFLFSDGREISVWNRGSFYNLSSAYEKGLLSQEEINNINNLQKGYSPFLNASNQ